MQPLELEGLIERSHKKETNASNHATDEADQQSATPIHGRLLSKTAAMRCQRRIILSIFALSIAVAIHFVRKSSKLDVPMVAYNTFNETEQRQAAYDLALERFVIRTPGNQTFQSLKEQNFDQDHLLNSIRIPKAGSSHLSLQARALVGCKPDGYPCCRGPSRSCPRNDLRCKSIIGCVDHRPNYDQVGVPLVTALRHPTNRLLSGFFYKPPHRPQPKDDYSWNMFDFYIRAPEYRNVMVKMLSTGEFAYHENRPADHTLRKAQDRLCTFAWFGINELPILSAMLLYESQDFSLLQPNRVVFGLQAVGDAYAPPQTKENGGMRTNQDNREYQTFQTETFMHNNGPALVKLYNEEDFLLYEWAVDLFCARARAAGLMEETVFAIASDEIQLCGSAAKTSHHCSRKVDK
ncbi:hypothetical protein MPSEU_000691200 [Mayamaea pseudoterrestris]|nr:hypothetical protein MPSEU_000691200 [Mayamaea pseudoterrestris]